MIIVGAVLCVLLSNKQNVWQARSHLENQLEKKGLLGPLVYWQKEVLIPAPLKAPAFSWLMLKALLTALLSPVFPWAHVPIWLLALSSLYKSQIRQGLIYHKRIT